MILKKDDRDTNSWTLVRFYLHGVEFKIVLWVIVGILKIGICQNSCHTNFYQSREYFLLIKIFHKHVSINIFNIWYINYNLFYLKKFCWKSSNTWNNFQRSPLTIINYYFLVIINIPYSIKSPVCRNCKQIKNICV